MLYLFILCLVVVSVIALIFKPSLPLPPIENDEEFEKDLKKELKEMEDEKRDKKLQVLRRRLKQKS